MRHFQTGTCSVLLLCTLLKNNDMTFLVQFGNNLHFVCFPKSSNSTLQTHAILILFEKPTSANYLENNSLNSKLYDIPILIKQLTLMLTSLEIKKKR